MASNPSTQEFIDEWEEKYYHLIWYARSTSKSMNIVKLREDVEQRYPEEIEKLINDETGYWQHGFNSGMLACLRLINGVMNNEQYAIDEFPMLDS